MVGVSGIINLIVTPNIGSSAFHSLLSLLYRGLALPFHALFFLLLYIVCMRLMLHDVRG